LVCEKETRGRETSVCLGDGQQVAENGGNERAVANRVLPLKTICRHEVVSGQWSVVSGQWSVVSGYDLRRGLVAIGMAAAGSYWNER